MVVKMWAPRRPIASASLGWAGRREKDRSLGGGERIGDISCCFLVVWKGEIVNLFLDCGR